MTEKKAHACLWVQFKKRRISAMLDTGSDITVVGADLVKKMRRKVHSTEMPSVYTANGEKILLAGVIKEDLIVGGRSVTSEIFVSPDLEGMIIGLDWLRNTKPRPICVGVRQ